MVPDQANFCSLKLFKKYFLNSNILQSINLHLEVPQASGSGRGAKSGTKLSTTQNLVCV